MRKLLLVEDDRALGETLRERLLKERYAVTWSNSLAKAEHETAQTTFDLIILDGNLPDGSGFEFARRVRGKSSVPFIFVTAMNSAEHRLLGYEIGAEEFIPKPFHLKELLLRIKHVLQNHASPSEVRVGDRVIDIDARAVLLPNGEKEFIAARDFDLLQLLISSAPTVVSRDEILDQVWGEDKFPSHRTVDNAIVRLRAAVGDTGATTIRTVRGVGYQWVSAVNADNN